MENEEERKESITELERDAHPKEIAQAAKLEFLFSKNARNEPLVPPSFLAKDISDGGFLSSPRIPEMDTQTPSRKQARNRKQPRKQRYETKELSSSLRNSEMGRVLPLVI